MTAATIRQRVASVCASQPFGFSQAVTPFSFDLAPTGAINEMFRIELETSQVIGGFNFTEDRTDLLHIWVARKYNGEPDRTYQRLLTDATSLRAAVVRDALVQSGDYSVPDADADQVIEREPGREFGVLRLSVPVNYETTL